MSARPCLLAILVALSAACDDVPFAKVALEGGAGLGDLADIEGAPTLCDVTERVLTPSCVTCHGAGGQSPELTPAAAASLVGASSALYAGATLVVPGDANASLLFRKLAGPGADEGAQMPLGGTLDPALVELVRAWIDDGASTSCEAAEGEGDDGGDEGEGEGPAVDGPGAGDDAGEGDDGGGPAAPNVCTVFSARCTACHSGSTFPDLRRAGLADLVGAASQRYAGRTLVVAGDVGASFLFTKVTGAQASAEGARMPLGGAALDDAQLAIVREWIESGAPADACDAPDGPGTGTDGEGEGDGEGDDGGDGGGAVAIVPGGDVVIGAPTSGYATTPPSFADGVSCSTGQWWQHAGDEEEGISMHPGNSCISCHSASDDDDAPRFTWAGTVMKDLRDEDDCRGVPGVVVDILDVNDAVIRSATTSNGGNFGISFNGGLEPFRVRLTYEGRTREMLTHQASTGDCMSCHTAQGANGAPGRIVVP